LRRQLQGIPDIFRDHLALALLYEEAGAGLKV
jgi:hypothetical protein